MTGDSKPIVCIAHRGARSRLAPENTLAAFEAAVTLGVEWIELDVHLVEGTLVVFHDHRLERLTTAQGPIAAISLETLRGLRVNEQEKIPLLEEVLLELRQRVKLVIELKGTETGEATAALLHAAIRAGSWRPEDFVVSSFMHGELHRARSKYPELQVAPLIYGVPHDLAACVEALGADSLHAAYQFISPELVADTHARGAKLYAYTVNTEEELAQMRALGVDGVFTDYPERLCRLASSS